MFVAIFPDGFIDFAFEAQFGEMSAKRCFGVLLEAVTSPAPTAGASAPTVDATVRAPTVKAKAGQPRQFLAGQTIGLKAC